MHWAVHLASCGLFIVHDLEEEAKMREEQNVSKIDKLEI